MEKDLGLIPYDYCVYEDDLLVVGVEYRNDNAVKFINGSNRKLKLKFEPSNKYDRNAVMVLGCFDGFWSRKELHIGYVNKYRAASLANFDYSRQVRARLLSTHVDEFGDAEIWCQLVGPKVYYQLYRDNRWVSEDDLY